MTREEYLSALKNKITSLTEDEKAEALQYYTDYFEDANDDEKVMAELGTPDEAAKKIMENFSNALSQQKSEKNEKQENDSIPNEGDRLCYNFENVTSLVLNLGAGHTVIIPGNKWLIETRGIKSDSLECIFSNEKLTVNTVKKMNLFDFFSHEHKSRIIPRILITIPCNANLNNLKIRLGAGLLKSKEISLHCKKTDINIGCGNLVLSGLNSESSNLKCGMGNMEITGKLTGRANIDCGMGAIKLNLSDKAEDYSMDCKVGLGEIRINDKKITGVQTIIPEAKKPNHLSINCGMGSVNCKTN